MQLTSCVVDSERATHSGARTPNLLNFLAPTGAAAHPTHTPLPCSAVGVGVGVASLLEQKSQHSLAET